jgi:hypothetical protein
MKKLLMVLGVLVAGLMIATAVSVLERNFHERAAEKRQEAAEKQLKQAACRDAVATMTTGQSDVSFGPEQRQYFIKSMGQKAFDEMFSPQAMQRQLDELGAQEAKKCGKMSAQQAVAEAMQLRAGKAAYEEMNRNSLESLEWDGYRACESQEEYLRITTGPIAAATKEMECIKLKPGE